jgi:hypothetical protein
MAFVSFATQQQIRAIAVENRKFHQQTKVDWMNRTVADPLFKWIASLADRHKDSILAEITAAAKKEYIPTVSIFSVYETVFAKKPGSREDCRHDTVHQPMDNPTTVLECVKQWHDTPSRLIPAEFWEYGSKAPDNQNDFYETLRDSDTLRLLENHFGDNFSCHITRKMIRNTEQFTIYKLDVNLQFHLTKRPEWRKEQISAAVKRFEIRQKAIEADKKWDRWDELNREDEKLADQLEAIPYPFTAPHAAMVKKIVARRKAIYAEMYPEDGPEYDRDDLNKMDLENRRGF